MASVLSSFGAALYLSGLLPPIARRLESNAAPPIEARCRSVAWWSLLAALVAGVFWLGLEAAAMADADTARQAGAAVPAVLFGTRFGQVLLAQALALAASGAALATRRTAAAACLAGLAVLLEAGHGHAFAMAHGSSALLVSQVLHLLAAGIWLGGLLPLFIVVRDVPLEIAAFAARRFSTLGLVAVLTLAVTALFQGSVLGGGWTGLTGTAYGAALLTKALLFALMIALAARNRFRLAPALMGSQGLGSRRLLLRAILVETALGLGVVLAAGVLSGLEPGMHRV